MKAIVVPVIASVIVTGCAQLDPREHQRLTSSLNACETQVSELTERLTACKDERDGLLDDVEARRRDNRRCADALEQTRRELGLCQDSQQAQASGWEERERALRDQLGAELTARDVEIRTLRGQLALSVLDRVLFDSGSAAIRAGGLSVLQRIAGVLAAGDERIRVIGHTDDVPIGARLRATYPTNWELSASRALSVVRFFTDKAEIEPNRLEAVGRSEYSPVSPNDTEEERQRNRRVEIILSRRN